MEAEGWGKEAGLALESPRVAALPLEYSEPQFPPLQNGCTSVCPRVVLGTRAEGAPGRGYCLTGSLFPLPRCVAQEKEWMGEEGPEGPERWDRGGAKVHARLPHERACTSVRSPPPRRPCLVLTPSFLPLRCSAAPGAPSAHAQLSPAPLSSRLSVAPLPALTRQDGEAQAEAEDDRVSVQRQLSQWGWGQRVAKGHKA